MTIKFNRIKKCLELDDQIWFGTHSGKTISYMLEFEPEYLLWATRQPNLIFLCDTAASRLEEKAARAKAEKSAQKQKQFQKAVNYDYIDDLDGEFEDVPF